MSSSDEMDWGDAESVSDNVTKDWVDAKNLPGHVIEKIADLVLGKISAKTQTKNLLKSLPSPSPQMDSRIMEELKLKSVGGRAPFKESDWAITKLLNPVTVQRSKSHEIVMISLVSVLEALAKDDYEMCGIIVSSCSDAIFSFLLKCLRSSSMTSRDVAAATIAELANCADSICIEMMEAGLLEELVEIHKAGDDTIPIRNVSAAMFSMLAYCKENAKLAHSRHQQTRKSGSP